MRLLDRYIAMDLLRQTLVTTGVLVVVIAFGAAIKPLSDGTLISMVQTLKYVGLVSVPMLQFAIPFAAGFAATMSMHRMTTDNEIVATAASGTSYARILRPIATMGVIMMLLMVGLTQWVIPKFWTLLENAVATDVVQILEATIERGDAVEFGDRQIFARHVSLDGDPADSGADVRLTLLDVTAVEIEASGRVGTDLTAEQAAVDVYRRPDFTYLRLMMAGTLAHSPQGGMLGHADRLGSKTIAIPTDRRHSTRNWTQGELLDLRDDPDRFGLVAAARRKLLLAVREESLRQTMSLQLGESGTVTLRNPHRPARHYTIRADQLARRRFRNDSRRPIEVVQHDDDAPRLVLRARRVEYDIVEPAIDGPVSIDLVLTDSEVRDLEVPDTTNRRRELLINGLEVEGMTTLGHLDELTSDGLLVVADGFEKANGRALPDAAGVEHEVQRVRYEIVARISMRYALSLAVPLLLLLGSVLAMGRRDSMPLTIYLWAFLPAVANLLLITSGEDLMRSGTLLRGGCVMWSGSAAMTVMLLVSFARLSRN